MAKIRAFDYGTLNAEATERLRQQAGLTSSKIAAAQTTADYVDIGRDLLAVKHQFPRGQFTHWLEAECRLPARTALNYMNAAALAEKYPAATTLPPIMIYKLAAKDNPPAVVSEIMRRVNAGEVVPYRIVEDWIWKAKRNGTWSPIDNTLRDPQQ